MNRLLSTTLDGEQSMCKSAHNYLALRKSLSSQSVNLHNSWKTCIDYTLIGVRVRPIDFAADFI